MAWWNWFDSFVSEAQVKLIRPTMYLLHLAFVGLNWIPIKDLIVTYPPHSEISNGQVFDFIIVGGGSAGCVLAARLAELEDSKVLLIEAGDDPPLESVLPALTPLVSYADADWNYYTEDDGHSSQAHRTRNLRLMQGKMLGGSSSTNHMYYVRGSVYDYDWDGMGMEWNFENVTYYFKKSEAMKTPEILQASPYLHGTDGPMAVTRYWWGKFASKYLKVFESKYVIHEDINGHEQLGYSLPQFTAWNNVRQSTANVFLQKSRRQQNLFILKNTLCIKILFRKKRRKGENLKAIGVVIKLPNEQIIWAKATKEVILSAGAINTPKLLMLSGIGPKEHLIDKKIDVLVNLHVGYNLQDHPTTIVILTGQKGIKKSAFENLNILTNLNKIPTPSILGFATVSDKAVRPEYQTYVFPLPAATLVSTTMCSCVLDLVDEICAAVAEVGQEQETLFTIVSLLHPESRGRVELRSKDPEANPRIYTRFYSNEEDLILHAKSVMDYIKIIDSPYLKSVNSTVANLKIPQCVDITFNTIEYWKCHILNTASTAWHPVGTCSMGKVVDNMLRVYEVTGLRIADASVIPYITSGDTNAPSIMIAEKLADLIKDETYELETEPPETEPPTTEPTTTEATTTEPTTTEPTTTEPTTTEPPKTEPTTTPTTTEWWDVEGGARPPMGWLAWILSWFGIYI